LRCPALARGAGEAGATAPCALNAGNEVAVAAFLAGECRFPQIADTVAAVLDRLDPEPLQSVEQVLAAAAGAPAPGESVKQVLAADAAARALARDALGVAA